MTRGRHVVACGFVLAAAAGCESRPQEVAVAGAPPAVEIPVGPMPGPVDLGFDMQNPYATDKVALMEGRRLFVRFNCAGCHGGHGGGGMGPSLRDVSWIYGNSDPAIFDSIAEGRAYGMPAWQMLPRQEIWKIVAYIKSMRTPLEPQPPTPMKYEQPAGPEAETNEPPAGAGR